jgi:hypothetical protein
MPKSWGRVGGKKVKTYKMTKVKKQKITALEIKQTSRKEARKSGHIGKTVSGLKLATGELATQSMKCGIVKSQTPEYIFLQQYTTPGDLTLNQNNPPPLITLNFGSSYANQPLNIWFKGQVKMPDPDIPNGYVADFYGLANNQEVHWKKFSQRPDGLFVSCMVTCVADSSGNVAIYIRGFTDQANNTLIAKGGFFIAGQPAVKLLFPSVFNPNNLIWYEFPFNLMLPDQFSDIFIIQPYPNPLPNQDVRVWFQGMGKSTNHADWPNDHRGIYHFHCTAEINGVQNSCYWNTSGNLDKPVHFSVQTKVAANNQLVIRLKGYTDVGGSAILLEKCKLYFETI